MMAGPNPKRMIMPPTRATAAADELRRRILATVDKLLQSTDRSAGMQLYYTDGRERAEREHLQIVTECRTGNVKKAARLLRSHILTAGQALVTLLRDRQQSDRSRI